MSRNIGLIGDMKLHPPPLFKLTLDGGKLSWGNGKFLPDEDQYPKLYASRVEAMVDQFDIEQSTGLHPEIEVYEV